MTKYNVHIDREMRLAFEGIDAESPEEAAAIARERPTEQADSIDDCDGDDLAALVDEAGDESYERSVTIDFEAERQRKVAPRLLAALRSFVDADELAEECGEWKWENLDHAFQLARAAITEAEAAGISPAASGRSPCRTPILAVSVRGGLIVDLDSTTPAMIVTEDWDVADEATGVRPRRTTHSLTGGLSGQRLATLLRLLAQD